MSLRLDLGSGPRPAPGFIGVDIWPEADRPVDLFRFPYPFADNSAEALRASHFVEHLPCREVEERDIIGLDISRRDLWKLIGKDFFFAFFDECWRILEPGGTMEVIVPATPSDAAFQDPTHRRFIVAETFNYLNKPTREKYRVDHYRVECSFDVRVVRVLDEALRTVPHAQLQAICGRERNAIHEFRVTLTKPVS